MLMALLVTSAFSGSTPSASLSKLKLLIGHADSSQLISTGLEMHLEGQKSPMEGLNRQREDASIISKWNICKNTLNQDQN